MSEFSQDDYVQLDSAIDDIEVFRPKSASLSPKPGFNPVSQPDLDTPSVPANLSFSRGNLIGLVSIPIILSMTVMLWQEFYQRADQISVTAIAAALFSLGILLAIYFTVKSLRGQHG